MADRRIDQLDAIQGSQIADDDTLVIFDENANVAKKATPGDLRTKLGVGRDLTARQAAAAAKQAADDAQADIDGFTPFVPTKANLYGPIKEILHPATNAAVNADDTNNELDIIGGDGTIINVPEGTSGLALTQIETFALSAGNSGHTGTLTATFDELPDVFVVQIDTVGDAQVDNADRHETPIVRKSELSETGGVVLGVGGVAGAYIKLVKNGTAVDWVRTSGTNRPVGNVTLYLPTIGTVANTNLPDGPTSSGAVKKWVLQEAADGTLTWVEDTGGLSTVESDNTITGDGSSGDPLSVAIPYSQAEKNKLAVIPRDAESNVQANWNETDMAHDAYILNKPTIPTQGAVILEGSRNPAAGDGAQGNYWFNIADATSISLWQKVSGTEWIQIASGDKNNIPDLPAGDTAAKRYLIEVATDGTETWEEFTGSEGNLSEGEIVVTEVGTAVAVSSANAVGPALADLTDLFLIEVTYTRTNTNLHMWSTLIKAEDLMASEYRLQIQGGGGAYISFYDNNGNVRISNAGATGYSNIVVRFFNETAVGRQGPPGEGVSTDDGRSRLLADPTDLPNDKVMVTSNGNWVPGDQASGGGGGGGGALILHNAHTYDINSTLFIKPDNNQDASANPINIPETGLIILRGNVLYDRADPTGANRTRRIPDVFLDAEELRALTVLGNLATYSSSDSNSVLIFDVPVQTQTGQAGTTTYALRAGRNADNELLLSLPSTALLLWPSIEIDLTASIFSGSEGGDSGGSAGPTIDDVVDISAWQGEFEEGTASNRAGRAYVVGQEFKNSTGYFKVIVDIAKGAVVTDVGNGANVEQLSGTALHIATYHEHIVGIAHEYGRIFHPLRLEEDPPDLEINSSDAQSGAVENLTSDIDDDRDLVHSIVAGQEAGIGTEMHISGKLKYFLKQNAPLSNSSGAILSVNLWLGASDRSGAGKSTAGTPTPYLFQLDHNAPNLAAYRNSNGGRDAYGSTADIEKEFSIKLTKEDFDDWALDQDETLTLILLGNSINGFASVKLEIEDLVITYDRDTANIDHLREEIEDQLRALVQHQEIIVDELPDAAGAAAPDYAYLSRIWRPTQGFSGSQGVVEYSAGEYQRTTGTANRAKFLFSNGSYSDGNNDRDIIGFIQRGNRLRVGSSHFLSDVGEAIHNPVGGAVAGIFFAHDPSNVLAGGSASWVLWVKRSLASRKPPWNIPTNIEQGGFKVRLYHDSTHFDIKFAHGGSFEVIDGIEYEYYYAPTTTGLSWINNLNLNDVAASTIEIEFRRETDNQLYWLGGATEGWTWRDPDENPTSISRIDKIERGSLVQGIELASLTGPSSPGQLTNRAWTIPAGTSGISQSNNNQHPTGNWTRYLYIDPDIYCHSLAGSHGLLIVVERGGSIVSSSYLPFTTAHAQWVAADEIFVGKWKTGASNANTLNAGWGVDSGRLHLVLACSGADNQSTVKIYRTN